MHASVTCWTGRTLQLLVSGLACTDFSHFSSAVKGRTTEKSFVKLCCGVVVTGNYSYKLFYNMCRYLEDI